MDSHTHHYSNLFSNALADHVTVFFFNDTATTEIYTFPYTTLFRSRIHWRSRTAQASDRFLARRSRAHGDARRLRARSEEHTSELQSLTNLVCRLLLEKKNPGCQWSPQEQFQHEQEWPGRGDCTGQD